MKMNFDYLKKKKNKIKIKKIKKMNDTNSVVRVDENTRLFV